MLPSFISWVDSSGAHLVRFPRRSCRNQVAVTHGEADSRAHPCFGFLHVLIYLILHSSTLGSYSDKLLLCQVFTQALLWEKSRLVTIITFIYFLNFKILKTHVCRICENSLLAIIPGVEQVTVALFWKCCLLSILQRLVSLHNPDWFDVQL